MGKYNFKPALRGLDDLKSSLSTKKMEKEIAKGLGQAAIQLHNSIAREIHNYYNVPYNSLDKIWINKGRSNSTIKLGQSILSVSLEYKYKAKDLSKFDYFSYPGNINDWAKRKGRVHEVEIVRGESKIVYGKKHFGGFVPKGFQNEYGAQMFERQSRSRKAELRVLFGPSVSEMAENVFNSKEGEIKDTLDNLQNFIISNIKF